MKQDFLANLLVFGHFIELNCRLLPSKWTLPMFPYDFFSVSKMYSKGEHHSVLFWYLKSRPDYTFLLFRSSTAQLTVNSIADCFPEQSITGLEYWPTKDSRSLHHYLNHFIQNLRIFRASQQLVLAVCKTITLTNITLSQAIIRVKIDNMISSASLTGSLTLLPQDKYNSTSKSKDFNSYKII